MVYELVCTNILTYLINKLCIEHSGHKTTFFERFHEILGMKLQHEYIFLNGCDLNVKSFKNMASILFIYV